MIRYVGIDLGQKGSIAVQKRLPFKKPILELVWFWDRFGGTRLRTATESELIEIINTLIPHVGQVFVAIEHPVLMPKNGKKAIAGLFENFGFMKGLISSKDVSLWTPTPAQWKKVGSFHGSDKTKMVNLATQLFRSDKINTETADSVLISEACRLYFQ